MTMIQRLAKIARPALEFPYVQRIRRNHGLEHATIHMLNRQRYRLSGRSSDAGFVIFGDVPTDKVEAAVQEALSRMQQGEHQLAIHPNCGTNLVTTGILGTLVAALGFGTTRSYRKVWDRFPMVMFLMIGVLLLSPALGMSLQKHFTTNGDPGNLEIVSVLRNDMSVPFRRKKIVVHNVITRQE